MIQVHDGLVHPTGQCFDDALDLLLALLHADRTLEPDLRLVHGVCRMTDGHLAAHAWIEDVRQNQVIFVGIINGERVNLIADRQEYWKELQVEERTPYTPRQAMMENRRTESYGPWIERYRLLCKPRVEVEEVK